MRRRVLLAAFLVPCAVACGLTVTGIEPSPSLEGGVAAPDGSAATDAPASTVDAPVDEGDAGSDAADAADAAIKDSGADSGAYAKCLAACKGADAVGCNSDGTCVVGGQDLSQVVRCPDNVPCEVDCQHDNDCIQGVDCANATSCKVLCTGNGACANNGVTCKGTSCDITCMGEHTCANGATCTASQHCGITCIGNGACANVVPSCNTNQGDCTITCGEQPNSEPTACLNGATCTAKTSCTVNCFGSQSCVNNVVTAKAATVNVTCSDGENCRNGVSITATTTGTVTCGSGNSCAQGVSCHAPTCVGTCSAGAGTDFCYQGPNITNTSCDTQKGFGGCP